MQIRINAYAFQISEPYQPGPRDLTEGECQAFNSLRAENVRNNCYRGVRRMIDALPDGEVLSQDQIAELQEMITKYDEAYVFLPKHIPRPRLGALEAETRLVATDRGIELYGAGVSEEQILALIETEEVQRLARERLIERTRVAEETLEDLLG